MLFIALSLPAVSQPLAEKSALNKLEKQKWDRGKAKFEKILQKDSINTTARYGMALYFVAADNPAYNIDSAYEHVMIALGDFARSTEKERDKLRRVPLDSTMLILLRERIDSLGFQRAKQINTEQAYIDFLRQFTFARQRDQAVELRDETAYLDALKENTYQAFESFLKRYPGARQATAAKERYERLLFETKTKDRKLKSYEAFLREHPQSPYRTSVEQQVFEIMTAIGTVEVFGEFLRKYPKSTQSKKARDILFHLIEEVDGNVPEQSWLLTDSLRRIATLNEGYLVPFLQDNLFGFMDSKGAAVIKASSKEMAREYLCGNINEDVLVMEGHLVNRAGDIIYSGAIEEVESIGSGFLYILDRECHRVIHKSGFQVGGDCVDDAQLVAGRYITTKSNDSWSLYSMTGRILISSKGSAMRQVNELIAFQQSGKWSVCRVESVGDVADQQKLKTLDGFDEVKEWSQQLVWVRKGDEQGVLNTDLSYRVPLSKQVLDQFHCGIRSVSSSGARLINKDGAASETFSAVVISKPWVSVSTALGWKLYDPFSRSYLTDVYDSISFAGLFALAYRHDSTDVFFTSDKSLTFVDGRFEFIPTKDTSSFLLFTQGDHKTVYNSKGRAMFTLACDKIQYAGSGHFICTRKEKKGLIDASGKQILPVEYDAIGETENGWIPLLRKMKFGLLDLASGKEIKPAYDKNIKRYSDRWFVAYKDGYYGFITLDNKTHGAFEFDDVRYWNDSAAVVKKNYQWQVISIIDGTVWMDRIKSYSMVADTEKEKIAIINQDNAYGVISNRKGVVIPATFTDIVNIGSSERPLYFTEKHVEEAYIFVVIYYNDTGTLIRRQAFDDDEYEKIYCIRNN